MPIMKALAAVMLLGSQAFVPRQDSPLCKAEYIPIEMAEAKSAGISLSNLAVACAESTSAAILLRNQGRKPIEKIELLIDMLDKAGSRLYSIPFKAQRQKDALDSYERFRIRHTDSLQSPINSGDEIQMGGEIASTAATCPSRAVVKDLVIYFSDGSITRKEGRDSRIGPEVYDAPRYFRAPKGLIVRSFVSWISVRINSTGKIIDFAFDESLDRNLRIQVESYMRNWVFLPATRDGLPTRSELRLRLGVSAGQGLIGVGTASPGDMRMKKPFVAVDMIPASTDGERWIVFYGGRPVATELPEKLP